MELENLKWIDLTRSRYLDKILFVKNLFVKNLFVKVPRPGDSEGTLSVFELSCHLLLPV